MNDKNKKRLIKVLAIILTIASMAGLILPFLPAIQARDIESEFKEQDGHFVISDSFRDEVIAQLEKNGVDLRNPTLSDVAYALENLGAQVEEDDMDKINVEDFIQNEDETVSQSTEDLESDESTDEQPQTEGQNEKEALPMGFEYAVIDGKETIVKSQDNNGIALQLDVLTNDFARDTVVLFLSNMETQEVIPVTFEKKDQYITTANVPDGYYVLYANDYAWGNGAPGEYFIMNKNEPMFIFKGSVLDSTKFPVQFVPQSNIYLIPFELTQRADEMVKINFDQVFAISALDKEVPEELKFEVTAQTEINNQETQAPDESESQNNNSIGAEFETPTTKELFLNSLKESKFIIIILVITSIVYFIYKTRQKKKLKESIEKNLMSDDGSVL